ncbi:Olfactory receptor-like protein OLF3 [Fukomys damarensis]|uniref:Olfactory receptor-like protein OLF3 n=2 Tax=Fukomys damarensis TaxID=885580 RepID=A0A091DSD7_FUKDA|nr:Olfactory receptor-like protein OLF3 [Fukomys damarensis]
MYFFLSVLSLVDIYYTNSTVPQMFIDFLSSWKSISFHGCVLQLYVSLAMGRTEFFLLGTIAYDCYVAVCHPLHYTLIMNGGLCLGLAAGCLVAGFMNSLMQTIIIFQLPLCHNIINYFACEMLAVLRLACADISFNMIMVAISGFLVIMPPCFLVLFSYACVVPTILHICFSQGCLKAFGICTSHLSVASMCFGTAFSSYMRPVSGSSTEQEKTVAFFYAIVTPILDPLIYSLRDKDVIGALQKVLGKFSQKG